MKSCLRRCLLLTSILSIAILSWTESYIIVGRRRCRRAPLGCPQRHNKLEPFPTSTTIHHSPKPLLANYNNRWEGDDLRRLSRLRRRWLRGSDLAGQPGRMTLVITTLVVYLYQALNTITWIRRRYPDAWSNSAVEIVLDTLLGTARPGPFTTAFSYFSPTKSMYRYLTAGFLHSSLIHWILTMDSLRRLPNWLEELGSTPPRSFVMYLTTFGVAVVGGHVVAASSTATNVLSSSSWIVGASGGIAGLYGLLYVSLVRMGKATAAWRVMKGMGLLFLYGCFIANMSNASHVGGFLSGLIVALLAAPRYRQSYALRRKNSVAVVNDPTLSRAYRTAMGYDRRPAPGWIPLWMVWLGIGIGLYLQVPDLRRGVGSYFAIIVRLLMNR